MKKVAAEVDGHSFTLAPIGGDFICFTRQELFVLLLDLKHPYADCSEVQNHYKVQIMVLIEEARKGTFDVLSIVSEEKLIIVIPTFF